jgi:hypothetical protein
MNQKRILAVLAAGAVLSAGLALFALHQSVEEGAQQFTPAPFFPGFASDVKNAARIHIVSHGADFNISNTPNGWVLPGSGGYPADVDEVRHTLIGLAALETIEPKTALPDWLHYEGLETPPKGDGVLIEVYDASGHKQAALIAGNMETIGDTNGAAGLFVRRPGEAQSWLARAVFVPHGAPSDWMLLQVLDLAPARLKDITIAPVGGRPFTLSRAHPSDANYVLSPALAGAMPAKVNAIPTALTSFSVNDARQASQIDFTKPAHVTAHTFDGLVLTLTIAALGNDMWTTLSATAAPGATPAVVEEARTITGRGKDWAYRLAPDKGRLLTATETALGANTP